MDLGALTTRVQAGLVGRREELRACADYFESLAGGAAALVVAGEPGIGKTRVWEAGIELARAGGAQVLVARGSSSEVQLSFSVLGDLLGDLEPIPSELPAPQRRALEAALLLGDHEGAPPDPRAVGLATLGCLRLLGAAGPVIVAVDDLQWVDAPSTRALEFALRRLGDDQVGLFATLRLSPDARLPFEPERAFGADRYTGLTIGPLSVGGIYELLAARLGLRLPRPALVRVHGATGGNPFFALELGRALARSGGRLDPAGDLPVPSDVDVLLRQRLADLPDDTGEALLLVALASDPTIELAEAVTRRDAAAAIKPAVEAEVLELRGGRLRFTHPLFAAAVVEEADPARRRTLHGSLAELAADPEERARHLARAATAPDTEAARVLEIAADLARRRGAPGAEAELLEHALRLAEAEDERARLTIAAAEAHHRAGDATRTADLVGELVARLPAGRRRAEALLTQVQAVPDSAHTGELIAQALGEADGDPRICSALLVYRAMLAELRIGLRSALGDAREAVRLAEEAGDEELLLRALVQAGHLETLTGGEEWLATLERAQALERRGYTTTRWLAPGHWIAVRLMWADELDQARELLEDEYRQAVEEGDAYSRAGLCFHLAQLETRAGQAARARAYADEGWGLNEASGREQDTAVNLYGKAVVEAQFGDADRARSLAQQALATFERLGDRFFTIHTRSALAQLALSLGDHARAAEVLAPAPALRAATEVGEPGIFPFDADEIEALIGVGRVDEAEALTGELERRGRMLDRPRLLATGARCRGLLLAARGDLEGAEGVLETAAIEHERLAVPLERGRTLLALGSVRRRLQRKRAARETLERALAIFDEIGTPRWAEQARVELGRIGGRTAPDYGELSATEARIADLVCSGKTNKEIAATLSLSPRTVQWNLSKVYRKLGVRSRTELAARLSRSRAQSGQAGE